MTLAPIQALLGGHSGKSSLRICRRDACRGPIFSPYHSGTDIWLMIIHSQATRTEMTPKESMRAQGLQNSSSDIGAARF